MDLVTRKRYPREQLFRLVKKDNNLLLDKDDTIKGRGYYVLKDKETLALLEKKKLLSRLTKSDTTTLLLEMKNYVNLNGEEETR